MHNNVIFNKMYVINMFKMECIVFAESSPLGWKKSHYRTRNTIFYIDIHRFMTYT